MEIHVEHGGGPFYERIVDLRYRVLRKPLGIAREQMDLSRDKDCTYVFAVEAGTVVGTVSLHEGHLRQMAVDPARQHSGIGRRLVARLEEEARRQGVAVIELHARETARAFYSKLGYVAEGATFTQVGIPHVLMKKVI